MELGSRYYISVHKTSYTNDSCDIYGSLRFSLLTYGRRRPTIDKSWLPPYHPEFNATKHLGYYKKTGWLQGM